MELSEQQKVIKDYFCNTEKNLSISARAGTGKTTTLVMLLEYLPSDKKALFLAFNKTIVEELKERIANNDNVKIMTLHGYGWWLLRQRYFNAKLDINKSTTALIKILKKRNVPSNQWGSYFYNILEAIDILRCNAFDGDKGNMNEILNHYGIYLEKEQEEALFDVFITMQKDKNTFDFTDMIYQPVTDPTIKSYKYDYVFCDESQDFSLTQQGLIKRTLHKNSRLITVGDESQAIYGFCGADANSYQRLANLNGESVNLPLSTSYRCAKDVIKEAQKIVPDICALENAELGVVRYGSIVDIKEGDWVLCRNLKPLIQMYLWLTKNKMKSSIRGIEIGSGIIKLINKTNAKSIDNLMSGLDWEREKLIEKLRKFGVFKPEKHPKVELLDQRIEVIVELLPEVKSVKDLVYLIESIFTEKKTNILLTTIHKSKGLENNRIFFICPELLPSKYATMDWQVQQENNLRYVAITRAKKELIYVSENTFKENLKVKLK